MRKAPLALPGFLLIAPAIVLAAEPAAPATAQPAAAAAAAPAAPATQNVVRAIFTSTIDNREPTEAITALTNDNTRIYYFTELRGLSGQKVSHRWEYKGKVMHEQPFEVSSARFRAFSSKTLDPSWTGEWKVSIVDGAGATLGVSTFSYTGAKSAPKPAPVAAAPAAVKTP